MSSPLIDLITLHQHACYDCIDCYSLSQEHYQTIVIFCDYSH
uniref:Uncharacterized protein n=1 Tax=Arundo donax TaxID=35708 RepID=A0A0A9AUM9_ARUDO